MRKRTTPSSTPTTTRREPRKVLWADVGVRVTAPLTLPLEEHQAVVAEIRTLVLAEVKKVLAKYSVGKKGVEFESY